MAEFIPYDPDEEAQLYQGDDPQVKMDPWGQNPDLLKEYDYLAAKAGKVGFGVIPGFVTQAISGLIPDLPPPTARTQKVDEGLDYLRWLTPLFVALTSRPPVFNDRTARTNIPGTLKGWWKDHKTPDPPPLSGRPLALPEKPMSPEAYRDWVTRQRIRKMQGRDVELNRVPYTPEEEEEMLKRALDALRKRRDILGPDDLGPLPPPPLPGG